MTVSLTVLLTIPTEVIKIQYSDTLMFSILLFFWGGGINDEKELTEFLLVKHI